MTGALPSKIFITGTLRSGKSYVSQKLSEKIGVPVCDLDTIVFTKPHCYTKETSPKERQERLNKIFIKDSWIIEGVNTGDWICDGYQKADIIIWIDIPAYVRLYRLLKRTLLRRLGVIKGKESWQNVWGMILLTLGFEYKGINRSRKHYFQFLKPYMKKVHIIRSKKELNKLVK